jgi:hypothetical protein
MDLETLRAILAAAAGVLAEHAERAADPLRLRWDLAFTRMPAGDRETVVAAVEREVELRALTAGEAEPIVGLSGLRANPNARLYFRIFDGDLPDLHRDEIMLSTLRAARMLSRPDALAFRALSAAERAALARHNRHMLRLLAECDAEASASPAAD